MTTPGPTGRRVADATERRQHRRGVRAFAMAPTIDLPTGNVRLITRGEGEPPLPPPDRPARHRPKPVAEKQTVRWTIRDADGVELDPALPTRSEAIRAMGALAVGGAQLPLSLFGPDGQPTGDRLA